MLKFLKISNQAKLETPMTAFLLIATHKYKQFIPQMLESLKKHYKGEYEVVLFTDAPGEWVEQVNQVYRIEHFPFPYPSLYRFKYFLAADLSKYEYVFYMDIDSRMVADIYPEEIHADLTAVLHCGFYYHPERIGQPNKESECSKYHFTQYYGGGFMGGETNTFLKACQWGNDLIDRDLANGVLPEHNDETVWNSYLSINPPTLELTPAFHYPGQELEHFKDRCWDGRDFEPKILLLKKNHEEIRN